MKVMTCPPAAFLADLHELSSIEKATASQLSTQSLTHFTKDLFGSVRMSVESPDLLEYELT